MSSSGSMGGGGPAGEGENVQLPAEVADMLDELAYEVGRCFRRSRAEWATGLVAVGR